MNDLKEFEYIQVNPSFNLITAGVREVLSDANWLLMGRNQEMREGRTLRKKFNGHKTSDKVTFLVVKKRLRGGCTIFLTTHLETRGDLQKCKSLLLKYFQ